MPERLVRLKRPHTAQRVAAAPAAIAAAAVAQ
jgi:hypothetical protein